MLNEPRIYRHSPFQIVMLVLVFGALAIGMVFSFDGFDSSATLLFVGFFALVFLFSLYSLTVKTTISDDEISTQSLLGTRTLKWSEINRVSGRGYSIKLHNFDGDVTVTPSPQLAGYDEVIDFIGSKRPDLFTPQEFNEMSANWNGYILLAVMILFVAGLGFFLFTQSDAGAVVFVFFLITTLFIGYVILARPRSLNLEGDTLFIKYFFKERSVRAGEVASITLDYTQTRNGKNYFIRINLTSKKYMRISGVGPNLPVVFLVLRNWHRKYVGIRQTTQQN